MNFLKLEEMTTEQKLGMLFTAYWNPWKKGGDNENDPELVKIVMEYISSKKIDNFDIKSVEIQLVGKKITA